MPRTSAVLLEEIIKIQTLVESCIETSLSHASIFEMRFRDPTVVESGIRISRPFCDASYF